MKKNPDSPYPFMFPEELTKIRQSMGLSRPEMARRLGVSKRALQYWEDGERQIPGPVVYLSKRLLQDHESVIEKSTEK
jgi:DNA-binding transcriptional regulator YiaG